MRPRPAAVATFVALAAAASALTVRSRPVGAAPLAVIEGEALDVSADRLDVDVEHGTALLDGNVSATLGDLVIHCPTIELRYDRSPRVSSAQGRGGVTAHLRGIDVAAETIAFDASSRKVTLSGAVRLSRGRGWVRAERASLDLPTGKVTLEEVRGSIPLEPPSH